MKQNDGSINDISSLVSLTPYEGTLNPYEKRLVYFKFSPRFEKASKGWKTGEQLPPRRDFALFMKIRMVGNIGAGNDAGNLFTFNHSILSREI